MQTAGDVNGFLNGLVGFLRGLELAIWPRKWLGRYLESAQSREDVAGVLVFDVFLSLLRSPGDFPNGVEGSGERAAEESTGHPWKWYGFGSSPRLSPGAQGRATHDNPG